MKTFDEHEFDSFRRDLEAEFDILDRAEEPDAVGGLDPSSEEFQCALEVARIRDLLGMPSERDSPDLRVLARVLNTIEDEVEGRRVAPQARHDAPIGGGSMATSLLTPAPAQNARQRAQRPERRWRSAAGGITRRAASSREPVAPTDAHTHTRGGSRTSRWWRPAAVGAMAAVALGGVLVSQALWTAPPAAAGPLPLAYPGATPAEVAEAPGASAVLQPLVQRALDSNPVAGSGPVQHVTSTGWNLAFDDDLGTAVILPVQMETWLGPDGSALLEHTTSAELRPDGRLDPDPIPNAPVSARDDLPAGSMPAQWLSAREPAAVLAELQGVFCPARDTVDSCVLQQVADELVLRVFTPEQNAALLRLFSSREGVHDLGLVRDRIGREVRAIAAPSYDPGYGQTVTVLLIDPRDGSFVGSESVVLSSERLGVEEPSVVGFTTITFAGHVAAVGDVGR